MTASCCFDREQAEAEIALLKALILEMRTAELAIVAGGAQSYTLGTGQTTQTVTKHSLPSLRTHRQSLQNELQMLELKLCGGASRYFRPGF